MERTSRNLRARALFVERGRFFSCTGRSSRVRAVFSRARAVFLVREALALNTNEFSGAKTRHAQAEPAAEASSEPSASM
jgi:hypothetical protein